MYDRLTGAEVNFLIAEIQQGRSDSRKERLEDIAALIRGAIGG